MCDSQFNFYWIILKKKKSIDREPTYTIPDTGLKKINWKNNIIFYVSTIFLVKLMHCIIYYLYHIFIICLNS